MPLDSRDQCALFEPLVDHSGKGPSTAGQPGLSGLVVGGWWSKNLQYHGQIQSLKNACQEPALKTMKVKLPGYKK